MILEVMGRDAGHIALAAGIAGGADIILIPRFPTRSSWWRSVSTSYGGVDVTLPSSWSRRPYQPPPEGVCADKHAGGTTTYGGIGHILGEVIAKLTGAETRVTVLGHVQRGGQPTWSDRLIASAFGVHAVDLIAEGIFDRMVAWQNRRVVDIPLATAIESPRRVEPDGTLMRTARGLGISLGDA